MVARPRAQRIRSRLLLVAGLVGAGTFAPPVDAQSDARELRDLIEGPQAEPGENGLGALTLDALIAELAVPGVSIAVFRDFAIHWTRAYGLADVDAQRRVDTETLFQAASISKPVAAMGTLRAVQDGLFTLDDDINSILTSWTLDDAGFTNDRPVTPRGLTSHTSGLGDGFGFPGYEPDGPIPTAVQVLEGDPLSNVGSVFMERPPMTFFEYSGGGVTVMQQALADARGRPFEEIMRSDVLEPIGMTRSTYVQPLPDSLDVNAARAHDRDGEPMGPKWHVYPEQAAAGLWTTPTDLALFAIEVQKSVRGESNLVLDRQHAREMITPVGVGAYAVGFSVEQRGEGWYFSHGGSNWGFRANLIAHMAKGYGLAVMTNGDRGSELIAELRRRVERAYEWDSVAGPVARGYR